MFLWAIPTGAQQRPALPGESVDVIVQPASWVPFRADIERNTVQVGRFWRDRNGSSRLQWDAADQEGRTIVIENVPQAKYYVYRPATGWTVQPMVLPTLGWRPLPLPRLDAGVPVIEDSRAAYERVWQRMRERRVPLLNHFAVRRESLENGTIDRYVRILVGDVADGLFTPPANARPTVLDEPGGIVAQPVGRNVAQ